MFADDKCSQRRLIIEVLNDALDTSFYNYW